MGLDTVPTWVPMVDWAGSLNPARKDRCDPVTALWPVHDERADIYDGWLGGPRDRVSRQLRDLFGHPRLPMPTMPSDTFRDSASAAQVLRWMHHLEYVAAWQPIPDDERPHWRVIRHDCQWFAVPLSQAKVHPSWQGHELPSHDDLRYMDYYSAKTMRRWLDNWAEMPRDEYLEAANKL